VPVESSRASALILLDRQMRFLQTRFRLNLVERPVGRIPPSVAVRFCAPIASIVERPPRLTLLLRISLREIL
jgi:hypothetical protein